MPSICSYKTCSRCATYNLPGNKKRLRCADHKTLGMISVNLGTRTCRMCPIDASYNYPGNVKRLFCKAHASCGMIDVGIRRCSTKGCNVGISNTQYKGMCMGCFTRANPDVKMFRNVKVREGEMTRFIKRCLLWPKAVYDKSIIGGTSMFRPDVYIDASTHAVIVECDENQHHNRSKSLGEIKRNKQLQEDANKPIVIIRFNPDAFLKDKSRIKSCFKMNSDGILMIRSEIQWRARLARLKKEICLQTRPSHAPKPLIQVVHLFFSTKA